MRSPRLVRKRSVRHAGATIPLQSLQTSEITNGERAGSQPVEKPALQQAADPENGRGSEEDLRWGSLSLGEPLPVEGPHAGWRSSWWTGSCGSDARLAQDRTLRSVSPEEQ